MKVSELVKNLLTLDQDKDIMVKDSIGPMDIGGPHAHVIDEEDADNCGNCEGRIGETVYVLSF